MRWEIVVKVKGIARAQQAARAYPGRISTVISAAKVRMSWTSQALPGMSKAAIIREGSRRLLQATTFSEAGKLSSFVS